MNAPTEIVFDAVSEGEFFALIAEGAAILQRLDESSPTFWADLRRGREILALIGDGLFVPQSEAERQLQEVERRYADVLKAHDETGAPLPAPNGQPSKLNRRQWLQVRTPAFKNWFGDWERDENKPVAISQAVDANGEPLVVYQGGKVDFDRFDPLRTSNEGGLLFFTDSPQLASLYAEHGGLPRRAHTFVDPDDILPQVKPVFLSIRHPLVADARGGTKDDIEGYYDLVDSVSYGRRVVNGRLTDETITVDGLILKNVVDMPNQALHLPPVPSTVIAVRAPNQAKSAIGNQGTFSADSDALLDSAAIPATDTFRLIAEGARLFAGLDEDAPGFFADLGRLREILVALGEGDGAPWWASVEVVDD